MVTHVDTSFLEIFLWERVETLGPKKVFSNSDGRGGDRWWLKKDIGHQRVQRMGIVVV